MENLVRLMLIRPAAAQDLENPSIDLTEGSPLLDSLRKLIAAGGDVRSGAKAASTAYLASSDFIGGPTENPFAEPLADLTGKLDTLEASGTVKHKDISDAIDALFGMTSNSIVKSQAFITL